MGKTILRFGTICALLLAFASSATGGDGKVTLLSISHLKSQLLPISEKANKTSVRIGGLSHVAGLVSQERASDPEAIFIQTGEAVEGSLWRYFEGVPEFSALSIAGVQVGMIGKRELDYGVDHLKHGLLFAAYPIVLSNVRVCDPELEGKLVRNVIIPAGPVKVGFFAMLSNWIFVVTRRANELTVLPDTESIAREMVADLRAKGADVIVMLSNLSEGENQLLAKAVSGIHVIMGRGVSEKEEAQLNYVRGPDNWTTALAWSGSRGRFLGKLVLSTRNGRLIQDETSWRLLNVTPKIPPNAGVMQIAMEYEDKLNNLMERAVGFFENPVDARKKMLRTREMPLGNFAADAMRWRLRTDIGLINGGALRGDRIFPAGEVSEKVLGEILPFANTLDVVTVTGAQLKQVMELSASALMLEGEQYDPSYRVPDGGFLQVSGLRAVYDLEGEPTIFDAEGKVRSWGSRLKEVSVLKGTQWREVADDETFTLAVNDWIAGGGDRYFVLSQGQLQRTNIRDLDALTDYLLSFPDGRVRMKTEGRITIHER